MGKDSERACLARLQEMDAALARMELELPDDVRPIGSEARKRVPPAARGTSPPARSRASRRGLFSTSSPAGVRV